MPTPACSRLRLRQARGPITRGLLLVRHARPPRARLYWYRERELELDRAGRSAVAARGTYSRAANLTASRPDRQPARTSADVRQPDGPLHLHDAVLALTVAAARPS